MNGIFGRLFIFALAAVFTLSCSREVKKKSTSSKITFQLPSTLSFGKSSALKLVTPLSTGWGVADPSSKSDIMCYGVIVGGPDADMSNNKCFGGSAQGDITAGQFYMPLPASSELSVEVSSGSDRVLRLVGFAATDSTACAVNIVTAGADRSNLSRPFLLAEQGGIQLDPGEVQEVALTVSFSANHYFNDCQGPAFGDSVISEPVVGPSMSITGISPTSGADSGGDTVQILGSGFATELPYVAINGQACTGVSFIDDSTVDCVTPPNPPGIYNVELTDSNATVYTLSNAFTYQPVISVLSASGLESGPIVVPVSLSAASPVSVSFDWTVVSGTAGISTDLPAQSMASVNIDAGATAAAITINITNDGLTEGNENFSVSLSNAVGAVAGVPSALVTIQDDDVPNIYVDSVVNAEASGNLLFTVSLDTTNTIDTTFDLVPSNGTAISGLDFTAGTYSGVISTGQLTTIVSVPIIDETTYENNETVSIGMTNISGALGAITAATGTITNDDATPSMWVAATSISEGSGNLPFTVSLSEISGVDAEFDHFALNGTAGSGVDFTAISGRVTIAPGSLSTVVNVPIIADALNESDETVILSISGLVGSTLGGAATAFGTIQDDDGIPLLFVENATGNENSGTISVLVTLSAASGLAVDFSFQTSDGVATSPADYTAMGPISFTIPAGSLSVAIPVTINDDALAEGAESFNTNISAPNNATIGNAAGVVNIADDEATPMIYITDASMVEGSSHLNFTVSLSAASGSAITFDYATSDGTAVSGIDYTSVSIASGLGAGVTVGSVSVPILQDALNEDNETFTVNLLNLVGVTAGVITATGTINDDDVEPTIVVNPVSISESAGSLTFTVSLVPVSGKNVSFSYGTQDGSAVGGGTDYSTTSGTQSIMAGSSFSTVVVPLNDDVLFENFEYFSLSLSGPVNASLSGPGNVSVVNGGIIDNDAMPSLSIFSNSAAENSGNLQLMVSLSSASGSDVTYNIQSFSGTAIGGTDYTSVGPSAHSIPAGSTTNFITVPLLDDALSEGAENFTVSITAVTGATGGPTSAVGTIADDEGLPNISIDDPVSVSESGGPIIFTVTMDAPTGSDVTMDYNTADGTALSGNDYTYTSGTLTISAGNQSAQISVGLVVDSIYETGESFSVNISNISGNGSLLDPVGLGTISDDDVAPSIYVHNVSISEDSGPLVFPVSLSAVSGVDAVFTVSTSDGSATVADSDYTSIVGAGMTIPAGSLTGLISVGLGADANNEPDENFGVHLGNLTDVSVGSVSATGIIINDDASPAPYIATFSYIPVPNYYGTGASFSVVAQFNEAVSVSGGVPRLSIGIGGVSRYMNYAGGTGTTDIIFDYTVTAGDNGAVTLANTNIDFNAAQIQNFSGTSAAVTFSNPLISGVTADSVDPSVQIDQALGGTYGACTFAVQPDPVGTLNIEFHAIFDEVVDGASFTTGDLGQTGSATVSTWSLQDCGDGINFKIEATGIGGDGTVIPDLTSAMVNDLAGNPNTTSTASDNSVYYDATAPLAPTAPNIGPIIPNKLLSPVINFTPGTDPGGTGIKGHYARIVEIPGSVTMSGWVSITPGNQVPTVTMTPGNQYTVEIISKDYADNISTAVTVPAWTLPPEWDYAFAGEMHTCGLNEFGEFRCWGDNMDGQLGDGTTIPSFASVSLSGGNAFDEFELGWRHGCGVVTTGDMGYCWGQNNFGQLGVGDTAPRSVPTVISGSWDVIFPGQNHTCGLDTGGLAYCWGSDSTDQLGNGTITGGMNNPVSVNGAHTFLELAVGVDHTCGVRTDNSVYCWGGNTYGQLGDGSNTQQPDPLQATGVAGASDIAAGNWGTCIVKSDGTLWCWGSGTNGGLGDGTTTNSNVAVQESNTFTDWVAVKGKNRHYCALRTNNSLWCWGQNTNGQLGLGDTTQRNSPTQVLPAGVNDFTVGAQHTCAVMDDGLMQCWGAGGAGRLGNGNTSGANNPIPINP